MLNRFIMKWSEPVKNVITEEYVSTLNDVLGLKSERIPSTLPYLLDHGKIDRFPIVLQGLIHGSQEITYKQPLKVGQPIMSRFCLEKVNRKRGASGEFAVATMLFEGADENGNIIYTMTNKAILTSLYIERNMPNER